MLKIGEYFRTPWGDIGKITNIPKHNHYFDDGFCLEGKFITCGSEAMKKYNSTPNIIELVQVGDYVNKEEVLEVLIDRNMSRVKTIDGTYFNEDIKSIVTKEQFESMEYRIGE